MCGQQQFDCRSKAGQSPSLTFGYYYLHSSRRKTIRKSLYETKTIRWAITWLFLFYSSLAVIWIPRHEKKRENLHRSSFRTKMIFEFFQSVKYKNTTIVKKIIKLLRKPPSFTIRNHYNNFRLYFNIRYAKYYF